MTTGKVFTKEEQKAIEALAQRRGFKTIREYMRALVEGDAKEHGDPAPFAEDEDDLGDPVESFRRGWAQAMRGETISLEGFRRRMEEDG